jgi:hypothetical protein
MLDDDQLESTVRELLIDLCEVLYRRGFEVVPVGAMMRLVGVSDERAARHDHEFFSLDRDFQNILETRKTPVPNKAPADATLH